MTEKQLRFSLIFLAYGAIGLSFFLKRYPRTSSSLLGYGLGVLTAAVFL